jgi:hypothetical protein
VQHIQYQLPRGANVFNHHRAKPSNHLLNLSILTLIPVSVALHSLTRNAAGLRFTRKTAANAASLCCAKPVVVTLLISFLVDGLNQVRAPLFGVFDGLVLICSMSAPSFAVAWIKRFSCSFRAQCRRKGRGRQRLSPPPQISGTRRQTCRRSPLLLKWDSSTDFGLGRTFATTPIGILSR